MASDLITTKRIEKRILMLRGQKVMLSGDLDELYEVEPKVLMQSVKRNAERFPTDFMFQLAPQELVILKSQLVTSSWGGRRKPPYAFTDPPEPPRKQIGFGVRERQAKYRAKKKKTV